MRKFIGCTALITGASSGIGKEFALQLAPVASRIILVARRSELLESLASTLRQSRPELRVDCHTVDLSDPAQCDKLIREVQTAAPELNLLINNAGLGDRGDFTSSEWSRVNAMLQVNIVALTELCHGLIPTLRENKDATIINLSSLASVVPIPDFAVYAASKAYVSSLSEALNMEIGNSGVWVTHVCPGPADTEFGSVAARKEGPRLADTPLPSPLKTPVDVVVRDALSAAARRKVRIFTGARIRFLAVFASSAPLWLIRLVLGTHRGTKNSPKRD
jgi:uncharacterized protein